MPTRAVPVFINRSPYAVPALLVDTATLSKHVAVPTPNEMVTKPPEAVLPSQPSIVTAPPLVLPSPKAKVKLPPLLVAADQEMIETPPPAAPDKSPAFKLNAPPMVVPEPNEIAMLLPKLDTDKQLPISRASL